MIGTTRKLFALHQPLVRTQRQRRELEARSLGGVPGAFSFASHFRFATADEGASRWESWPSTTLKPTPNSPVRCCPRRRLFPRPTSLPPLPLPLLPLSLTDDRPHADDYGWQDFSALQATTTASGPVSHLELRQACFCGSPQCSGWLGGKKDKKLSGRQVPESSSGGGGSGKYRASGSGKAAAGKSFGGVPGSRFGAGRKVVVVPALRKGLVGKKMKGEGSDSESEGPKGPTMEASCKKCRERKVRFFFLTGLRGGLD